METTMLDFPDDIPDAISTCAAFFGLQSFLHKWGGEFHTKYADEQIAYDFLFLHLYQRDAAEEFRQPDYYARWEREFKGRQEEIASYVRNSFCRRGRGEKLGPAVSGPTGRYRSKMATAADGWYCS